MDQGALIATGTPEEIRHSQHPRVLQFMNRTPEGDQMDAQAYLRALTQN
jgi:ABC-type transporter Mla maintaining outer membrane lipid asymmetry ATPase subunit MlaF